MYLKEVLEEITKIKEDSKKETKLIMSLLDELVDSRKALLSIKEISTLSAIDLDNYTHEDVVKLNKAMVKIRELFVSEKLIEDLHKSELYCNCEHIIVADYIDKKYCSQCDKPMDKLNKL